MAWLFEGGKPVDKRGTVCGVFADKRVVCPQQVRVGYVKASVNGIDNSQATAVSQVDKNGWLPKFERL